MHRSLRLAVLSPCLLIALLAAAVFPMTALAEEATPPPPVEETTAPEGDSPAEGTDVDPTEPAATEVVTEVAPSELLATEASPTESPPTDAPTDVLPTEAASTESLPPLPEGTEVVVLDAEGNPVPLATNEAAEIIANGDPVWCPTGAVPGDAGCTSSYTLFNNSAPYSGLIPIMLELSSDCSVEPTPAYCPAPDGTIYIASSYSSASEGAEVSIDHSAMPYFGNLTIQGGWDGVEGDDNIVGTSTFNLPLRISWVGDITLNDLVLTNVDSGVALFVQTVDGDITLDNVNASGNDYDGANLDNCADPGTGCTSTGNIRIMDSTFDDNDEVTDWSTALRANSGGDLTLQGVQVDNNHGRGAELKALDEVVIDNSATTLSSFSGNGLGGLEVFGSSIVLDQVDASNNNTWGYLGGGASLFTCDGTACGVPGTVLITDSTFSHNQAFGLVVQTGGSISLYRVEVEDNGYLRDAGDAIEVYGAYLDNCILYFGDDVECVGSGDIYIEDSLFHGNYSTGLLAQSAGVIEVKGTGGTQPMEISDNGWGEDMSGQNGGADLSNSLTAGGLTLSVGPSAPLGFAGPPGIFVSGASITGNGGTGLMATSLGEIAVEGTSVDGNGTLGTSEWDVPKGSGALLDNCLPTFSGEPEYTFQCIGSGDVSIDDSSFSDNAAYGLLVRSFGNIGLEGVTAEANGWSGAILDNAFDDTTGSPSAGSTVVLGGSFGSQGRGNLGSGLVVESYGSLTIEDVTASFNGAGDREADTDQGYGVSAYLNGEGVTMDLVGVTANYNEDFGLYLGSWYYDPHTYEDLGLPGDITLTDVTASHNGRDGADIETSADIVIDPSSFNFNDVDGLDLYAENIYLECATAVGNGDDGVDGYVVDTATLSGCRIRDNHDADIDIDGDVDLLDAPCADMPPIDGGVIPGGEGEGSTLPPLIPPAGGMNTVNVSGAESVGLDCAAYAGTILMLANGDHAVLPCPIGENATLQPGSQAALPGALDGGLAFVSAMELGVTQNGQAVGSLGGTIGIHFIIPAGTDGASLSVLHWDGGQWEKLGGSVSPDGYFEVPHDETGLFVLVSG